METDQHCPICKNLMYGYKIKHNGVDEIVYRCQQQHGPSSGYSSKYRPKVKPKEA